MKSFEMVMPASIEEAAAALAPQGDKRAMLLAGGQDLLTELKEHLAEPDRIVNLKSVPGLAGLEWDADGNLEIGSLTTLANLASDPDVRARLPVLAEAAESVGSPQIRSMGTVGGNLNQRPRCWYYRAEHMPCLKKGGTECYSYEGRNKYNAILGGGPSYIVHPSDLAPALVALGAFATLTSATSTRRILLEDYYTLPSEGDILTETRLLPGEIMTKVQVPAPREGMRSTYLKFKERESYDFALAAVALCLWFSGENVQRARIVLGGVAPRPWRAATAEQRILSLKVDDRMLEIARERALDGAVALSDNAYKIPLTKGLLTRAILKLA